jgi:dephospho-CoA kinase
MGKRQIKIVGVTGGIGCGKSFLCRTFNEEYDIPVFYCDIELRKIINTDPFVISEVKIMFGDDIYVDNKANSKEIAEIIFNDENARIKLEMLTRGPLLRKFYDFVYIHHDLEIAPFVLIESAIMIESGFFKLMDEIIYVRADDYKERIEHLVKERGFTEEEVNKRMTSQMSLGERISALESSGIKCIVFHNDFSKETPYKFAKSFYISKDLIYGT